MTVVKLILLLVAALVFLIFASNNWNVVTLVVGPKLILIQLPILVLVSFLAGALPFYIANRISRRSWTRRLARVEAGPVVIDRTLPSEAQPTAVPPAVG